MSAENQSISVTVRIGSHKRNVSMRPRNLREISSTDFKWIQQCSSADAKQLAHDRRGSTSSRKLGAGSPPKQYIAHVKGNTCNQNCMLENMRPYIIVEIHLVKSCFAATRKQGLSPLLKRHYLRAPQ